VLRPINTGGTRLNANQQSIRRIKKLAGSATIKRKRCDQHQQKLANPPHAMLPKYPFVRTVCIAPEVD
jgi:hypothetical protein